MAETEGFLLRRFAKTGDAEAFAEIIRRHAGLVYGAALRILADVDRASDVAQDTFLQLTRDAHSVTGSLPGWLHRVATRKAIDQMRRERSRRRREAAYAAGQPRKTGDWKEISPYVDEEISRLDPEIRDILIAHFLQGQTTRHIAVFRGVSQATVSRRIEAGVATLRAVLRRRGILVATGTLGVLLRGNAVQAAPMALMTELGKMALVGGRGDNRRLRGADACRRRSGRCQGQSGGGGGRSGDRRRFGDYVSQRHEAFCQRHRDTKIGNAAGAASRIQSSRTGSGRPAPHGRPVPGGSGVGPAHQRCGQPGPQPGRPSIAAGGTAAAAGAARRRGADTDRGGC